MTTTLFKYPRIGHFSFSPNLQNDDRRLSDDNVFVGKNIVVSLKLDGEGFCMTRESCHARSLTSSDHPSRHWIKSLHGQIKSQLPQGHNFFGENMFAAHSIFYGNLPTFFFLFTVVDDKQNVLSWSETKEWAELLGLYAVPALYEGPWDLGKVQNCYTNGKCPMGWGDEQEGYVVRNAASFPLSEWESNYGKVVRSNHVKTGDFWMRNWKPNKLKET